MATAVATKQADIVLLSTLQAGPDDMPTTAEMLAWRDTLDGEFGSFQTRQEAEVDVYYQAFQVESFGEAISVKTGSAPSDCDAAIDSLTPKDLSIRRKPRRAREKYRTQAAKSENFGRAWLKYQRKRHDLLRDLAADMTLRSVGVARVLTDLSGWPTMPSAMDKPPERQQAEEDDAYEARYEAWQDEVDEWEMQNRRECPIVLERRDCRYVRWRERNGVLMVVSEKYETTVLEAYQAFSSAALKDNVAHALRGKQLNDRVWVSDVWFKRYRCVFIDDKPIFPYKRGSGIDYKGVMEHGYPGIPYLIAAFREIPADDPADRYRGLLSNSAQLYEMESSVLVMHVQMLRWNAWRTWTYWTKDGRPLQMVPGQGQPLEKRVGEFMEMVDGPSVPPEVLQTVSVVDAYIQRNGVAQGPRTAEGTRSAQQLWAIQAQRSQKIEPAQDSLTLLIEGALELAMLQLEDLLKTYGGTLTLPVPGKDKEGNDLGEVTMRASDVGGYYGGWIVNPSKRLDPALLQQAQALMTMAGNKWMPKRMSVELSALTDSVQEWLDELLEEDVESLPFLKEQAGLAMLAQWFGEDSPQYQATFAKVMASKNAPSGQQPGPNQAAQPKGPPNAGSSVGDALQKAGQMHVQRPRGKAGAGAKAPRPPAH